ncbi:MAG TPA: 6,7-dimethyl-8-ribityllumazine synthase [Solirubrobacterales bacterium]|nr:6,7-dimethyl-8-ribityllumazine synthase [Solirubrobacterales bacterium]
MRQEDGEKAESRRELDAEESKLSQAERSVERLEKEAGDGGPDDAGRTELPEFSGEEREALAELEFAVCVARFYPQLAERLLAGATEGFSEGGVSQASVQVFDVPGAFELPMAAKLCAESGSFAGVACLGVVIRGETDHYDYVCAEAARGVQQAQLESGVPCSFGVITCETIEQALARAGGGKRDQGRGAALVAMKMALLRRRLAG